PASSTDYGASPTTPSRPCLPTNSCSSPTATTATKPPSPTATKLARLKPPDPKPQTPNPGTSSLWCWSTSPTRASSSCQHIASSTACPTTSCDASATAWASTSK